MTAYRGLALQVKCQAVSVIKTRAEARGVMRESLVRLRGQVAAAAVFIGEDTKLIVLPEYFLTGYPMGESIGSWAEKAALEMDGPEYDALGGIAQDAKVYLGGNAYEADPKFPGLHFQTSFLIDPSGDVILRYRRLNSMYAPTPHDVWERYLDAYGLEGVFPVARTPLGNIAAIASDEILFPEVARCHAMRGAEVFLHSTAQASETARAVKDACAIARAVENCAYVVSANTGGFAGTPIPDASTDGGSKIIDYQGLVLVKAGWGETCTAYAEIDLAALRRFRRRPGMENLLARQRFEAYAESYAGHQHYPPNNMAGIQPERDHFPRIQRETLDRLSRAGVI
ncbi:MAG: nitrilase-related carbon-nitrogen hydrolase [Blastocatellia bacterium]